MTTRCKFRCDSVTKFKHSQKEGFVYNAKFGVVYGDSPENKQFFASTPTGQLEVGTISPDHFEPGKEYYLDITEAVAPAADASPA